MEALIARAQLPTELAQRPDVIDLAVATGGAWPDGEDHGCGGGCRKNPAISPREEHIGGRRHCSCRDPVQGFGVYRSEMRWCSAPTGQSYRTCREQHEAVNLFRSDLSARS